MVFTTKKEKNNYTFASIDKDILNSKIFEGESFETFPYKM